MGSFNRRARSRYSFLGRHELGASILDCLNTPLDFLGPGFFDVFVRENTGQQTLRKLHSILRGQLKGFGCYIFQLTCHDHPLCCENHTPASGLFDLVRVCGETLIWSGGSKPLTSAIFR
jgi:hypothetical protein